MLASSGTQPSVSGPSGPVKGSHLGEVTLELQPSANRKYLGQEIVSAWRDGTPCALGEPVLVHYEELHSRPGPFYLDGG